MDIGDLSIINLVVRLRGGAGIEIKVQTYEGKEIKIAIETSNTIESLKKKIYQSYNELSANKMDLYLDNVKLEDKAKITQYSGIKNGTLLN